MFPVTSFTGFPQEESGYDLEKLEKCFRLLFDEIGNDEFIADEITYQIIIVIFNNRKI